jgi:hypothetical protein
MATRRSGILLAFATLAALAAQCDDKKEETADAPLTVETRSLSDAALGSRYIATLEASGGSGAYSWTAHGALPPGLVLTADSGQLRGTPAAAGQYVFMVQVSDGRGTARRTMALSVGTGGQLGIVTSAIGPATARAPFGLALQAGGGTPPYDWSIATGAFPGGLTLDAATGAIAGSPMVSGSFPLTVRLRDAAGGAETRAFTIQVNAPPTIVTASLGGGTVGRGYAEALRANGGTPPLAWLITAGRLPAGLALDAGSGAISGTPVAPGVASLTVRVADAAGASETRPFSLAVTAPLAIAGTTLSTLTVDRPFSVTLPVLGGTAPYAWRVGAGDLPTGLALDASGAITGTPSVTGSFECTVQVTDAASVTATLPLRFTVVSGPAIVTTAPPEGRVRRAYRLAVKRSGGTGPFAWSVAAGGLPGGLALAPDSGVIAGTPTAQGRWVFTVRVMDAAGAVASRQLAMTIR